MSKVPEMFGSMVFNDSVMHDRLPKDIYRSLKKTIDEGKDLDIGVANVVASAMKDWAIENGATHYTHWFQPMTGITAEKHDSFISPQPDGTVIMEFSGKELIKGEPDASSFPSGGIRATFEARGYTAWDPTSPAFIKENTLCIPTSFVSYTGDVLDKKTPLLRSMEEVSRQAKRVLALFGQNDVKRVLSTVGPEQEYFIIDKDLYDQRKDLIYTGRTLFGAPTPKGQEMEDHYFGSIKPRIKSFMYDLNEELWKLGILAKTEHNEVAPAQHELAPVFTTANIATDHNQLTMEIMKKVAHKHGLACLLHEKPFDGVNGSGKHDNWSLSTESGENLLEPGHDPYSNTKFLLFLVAVIKAVDDYQDLLRISVANAGNDHRLGANEAPPAIVSMFLGEELQNVLDAVEAGKPYHSEKDATLDTGVNVLPAFKKDNTDRNRTSPFAFTGNKFEFRMLGSTFSISEPNIILNTIVAESLSQFADILENASDFETAARKLIKDEYVAHKRIVFNGNGYSDEWVEEAEKRGLLNLKTTADAIPHYKDDKNVKLFTKHNIFSEVEVVSRTDILLEEYSKTINIEAITMLHIASKEIIPAVVEYLNELCESASLKKSINPAFSSECEEGLIADVSAKESEMYKAVGALKAALKNVPSDDAQTSANYYRDVVIPAMADVRKPADELELLVGREYWPFPTYGDLLFSVV
ncbi:MAG: glutamine synthetase III [Oscillospiraceae bacterium]|nr:glutamine synthetase III [Oscillospiraceae bacterium]